MLFENLQIGRIVIHEVHRRNEDRSIRPPTLSNKLENLNAEAIGAFRLRMTEALSGQNQSLEMKIIKYENGSFLGIAESLIGTDDSEFVARSKAVASRLAEAQMARQIPGGMLIVFDGTVGSPASPFVGVIKAETQAGFNRVREGNQTVIEFLQNIFLTPATRLYKIGILLRFDSAKAAPEGWKAFVFDSNISLSNREAAAAYFYEAFLGCALPSDGSYETAKFFDLTKEFVRKSDLAPEKKRDIIDSLYVFVRDEQEVTFTSNQFGDRYLPGVLRDPYGDFMRNRRFTPNAVVRDVTQMGNRLRRRRLKFGSDIELSASPEALADKVSISAIEPTEPGIEGMWTQVIIRATLSGEQ